MDAAARLVATEEIRRLKARYFRLLDTKAWRDLVDVFSPDAEMDVRGEVGGAEDGLVHGPEAIVGFIRDMGSLDDATTVHHGHTAEIEIHSPATASGVWAMEDRIWWPEPFPIESLHGWGHYHETYVHDDDRWRIATMRLVRTRLDIQPR